MDTQKRTLLILGPTGTGKTRVIAELCGRDSRFMGIHQYTTRPRRENETGKVFVSDAEMEALAHSPDYCVISTRYRDLIVRYAISYKEIQKCIQLGRIPVLDWAISRMSYISPWLQPSIFSIYLLPPSIQELERRLRSSPRNNLDERIEKAQNELNRFYSGEFAGVYDTSVVNTNVQQVVEEVLRLTRNVFPDVL